MGTDWLQFDHTHMGIPNEYNFSPILINNIKLLLRIGTDFYASLGLSDRLSFRDNFYE